jgi:hypothetical protein
MEFYALQEKLAHHCSKGGQKIDHPYGKDILWLDLK